MVIKKKYKYRIEIEMIKTFTFKSYFKYHIVKIIPSGKVGFFPDTTFPEKKYFSLFAFSFEKANKH